jgi:hypothetical protein
LTAFSPAASSHSFRLRTPGAPIFIKFDYSRIPQTLGADLTTYGFPSAMQQQIPAGFRHLRSQALEFVGPREGAVGFGRLRKRLRRTLSQLSATFPYEQIIPDLSYLRR